MVKMHSPEPWTYKEDEFFYFVYDAEGNCIATIHRNTTSKSEGNLLAVLAVPDLLSALRRQPAYGDEWKQRLREAFACASGLLGTFLPARRRK